MTADRELTGENNMAKILKFNKKPEIDPKTANLLAVSDDIDTLMAEAIFDHELDPKDVAGLLAHRLGSLIRQVEGDDRDKLIAICKEVMMRQATKSTNAK
jgi:hypothetical protein